MGRILAGLVGLVVIIALVFAGWYYRPWAPYSPAAISALEVPEDYKYTFQRMDEILPYSTISAPNPAPLPTRSGTLPETYEFDGETKALADYVVEADITGLAVLHNGALIHQSAYHGADAETRHTSYSVAKSFVATLIAKAMHDGLIDSLDNPAQRYAPQFEGTDFGDTSLRHLLMMSTGIDFNEEYSDSGDSDIRPLFFNAFILGRNVDDMVGEYKRNREPGQDFHYISPSSHVLSAVVRSVYGGKLADIMSEHLWGPLGMTAEANWLQNRNDDKGMAIGYCCLQATSVDFARFGEFLRNDGVWDGQRLLPEGWVAEATVPNAPFQEPEVSPYGPRGYGLHFWMPENYNREYAASGVFGQYIWVDERRGVVIAQNAGDPIWYQRYDEAIAVFRAISEHVSPLVDETEPETTEATETEDSETEGAND